MSHEKLANFLNRNDTHSHRIFRLCFDRNRKPRQFNNINYSHSIYAVAGRVYEKCSSDNKRLKMTTNRIGCPLEPETYRVPQHYQAKWQASVSNLFYPPHGRLLLANLSVTFWPHRPISGGEEKKATLLCSFFSGCCCGGLASKLYVGRCFNWINDFHSFSFYRNSFNLLGHWQRYFRMVFYWKKKIGWRKCCWNSVKRSFNHGLSVARLGYPGILYGLPSPLVIPSLRALDSLGQFIIPRD